jgi:NTP pyrophosphatase (non-canonical NTP hydrolase)
VSILEEVEKLIPKNHAAIKRRHKVSLESQKLKVIEEVCEVWKAIQGLYFLQANIKQIEELTSSKAYCSAYKGAIEGTVQSELADAVISLMTYCGEAGINHFFTVPIMARTSPAWYLKLIHDASQDFNPDVLMSSFISIAELYGIDILKHIHLKMRFNANRRDWQ